MNYEIDYRPIAKSGDTLLCDGNGVLSDSIQLFQGLLRGKIQFAHLSHCAKVIRFTPDEIKGILIFSANANLVSWVMDRYNEEDKEDMICVFDAWWPKARISLMSDWLKNYDGKVWVRRQEIIDPSRYQPNEIAFVQETLGVGYNTLFELIRCGMACNKKSDNVRMDCSEAVARCDQRCNTLPLTVIADNVAPDDLYPGNYIDKVMQDYGVAKYGDMVRLTAYRR